MKYFLLEYDVVDDYVARRAPFREEHLRRVREGHTRGEIVLAGALGDPVDGAALLFRADSPRPAEQFARDDPYVVNGLVTRWRVRPWSVVVEPASGPSTPVLP
jgi:uncharacterized protein YciI